MVELDVDFNRDCWNTNFCGCIWKQTTWTILRIGKCDLPKRGLGFPFPVFTKIVVFHQLAAISSFIFQLPFQLCLLECHLIGNRSDRVENEPEPTSDNHGDSGKESNKATTHDEENSGELVTLPMEIEASPAPVHSYKTVFAQIQIWAKVGKALQHNPVLWAIAIGFVLSLTKVGPKYFNPNSPKYVTGLGWAWDLFGWLGDCVSPVSLVAMGSWMQRQERILLISPAQAMLCMFLKLILVPLLMVGLALMVDLEGNNGRAAVLIAALPISLASFSLAAQYEIGEHLLSTNVMLGTLLLLPTILVWNLVLDAVDLFPITKVG